MRRQEKKAVIDRIYEIGKMEGIQTNKNVLIDGLNLDVVYYIIEPSGMVSTFIFDVQPHVDMKQTAKKLQTVEEKWGSTLILVTSTEQKNKAKAPLEDSFSKIKGKLKIISFEEIERLHKLEKEIETLLTELLNRPLLHRSLNKMFN